MGDVMITEKVRKGWMNCLFSYLALHITVLKLFSATFQSVWCILLERGRSLKDSLNIGNMIKVRWRYQTLHAFKTVTLYKNLANVTASVILPEASIHIWVVLLKSCSNQQTQRMDQNNVTESNQTCTQLSRDESVCWCQLGELYHTIRAHSHIVYS